MNWSSNISYSNNTSNNCIGYQLFGALLPGRHSGASTRYGYQGSECDPEVKGEGNSYTTLYRQLDPRLGRWLTIDPMASSMPWQSPYSSMGNNPISRIDPLGNVDDWVRPKGSDEAYTWSDEITTPEQAEAADKDFIAAGSIVPNCSLDGGPKGDVYLGFSSKDAYYADAKEIPEIKVGPGGPLHIDMERAEHAMEKRHNAEVNAKFNQQLDNFMMIYAGAMLSPFLIEAAPLLSNPWTKSALNAASRPFFAATGRYGAGEQLLSIYSIGNSAADATVQISQGRNLKTWNYGSTLGNLYFSNPWVAAAPGAIYQATQDGVNGRLNQTYGNVLMGYSLNVAGNFISGGGKIGNYNINGIQNTPLLNGISNGTRTGLGSYTIPVMWNIGSNSDYFKP